MPFLVLEFCFMKDKNLTILSVNFSVIKDENAISFLENIWITGKNAICLGIFL